MALLFVLYLVSMLLTLACCALKSLVFPVLLLETEIDSQPRAATCPAPLKHPTAQRYLFDPIESKSHLQTHSPTPQESQPSVGTAPARPSNSKQASLESPETSLTDATMTSLSDSKHYTPPAAVQNLLGNVPWTYEQSCTAAAPPPARNSQIYFPFR